MTTEASPTRSGKVVIGVDDQPENLAMLKAIVEARGDIFFRATGGLECLSLAARTSPRLILLDIQMPGMDGFETCRHLRSNWALRPIPVAFLTSRRSVEDVKKGIAAGGNDFISKPFDVEKLAGRIDYWTSRRINPSESQSRSG